LPVVVVEVVVKMLMRLEAVVLEVIELLPEHPAVEHQQNLH
jgi:hypothetical protein